ncbi:glucose-induced degradation protein 8 homolog [Anopheles bellator]|uniref:glucose-induced degradation protein 8 homolog n=1 Tax=Anopheles bellator TaxID=139047 RepID=UPI00264726B9|nr:glucose-induced degradation protein 8 homolog [Anopheles bellator]
MSGEDLKDGILMAAVGNRLATSARFLDHHDTNRIVMEYLEHEGFIETACEFRAEPEVVSAVSPESAAKWSAIRGAIQSGSIREAIRLVNQSHPELLASDRYLHFHLQQLHLIELIRAKKIGEALDFAQTELAETVESNPIVLDEMERTLALLVYENPQHSPFANRLGLGYRLQVASELNAAILKLEHLDQSSPAMINILKLILWAQTGLDGNNVQYRKMTDLATATIEHQ